MRENKAFKIVICALFAALTCVATWLIKVPLPVIGYINLGDCIVLLGSFVLGPIYGAIAGGVGSALADLLAGYVIYVPATFIIKALMGLAAGYIFLALNKKNLLYLSAVAGGVIAEFIMILGYFIYEMFIMGYGMAAITNMPFNGIQGAVGILLSVILYAVLQKSNALKMIK